ncbi:MAG: dihydrofolate reductase, partial [Spirochaetae bacterium HGW-Spirochaetae-10]
MRKLIYHVAVTVDGFIARKNGSVDGFLMQGDHVDAYLEHLKDYDTVVMGRRTYEAG